MFIVAQHRITDPPAFWSTVAMAKQLPPGLKLHSTFPSSDGSRAVCLWEAPSLAAVRDLVESVVGPFSHNEYFQVSAEQAMGLPKSLEAAV